MKATSGATLNTSMFTNKRAFGLLSQEPCSLKLDKFAPADIDEINSKAFNKAGEEGDLIIPPCFKYSSDLPNLSNIDIVQYRLEFHTECIEDHRSAIALAKPIDRNLLPLNSHSHQNQFLARSVMRNTSSNWKMKLLIKVLMDSRSEIRSCKAH
ncbi:hypothetical protein RDI58_028964 [Solanum bulbocastanum]|uniref:Uncharacterized protein n=1 Tax=Solanum bulbocastanum TaxID=147425 RepID=A0AAN8XZH8_SOLBU